MTSLSFWLFIDYTSLKKTTSKEFKIKDELISNKNELENFKIDDPKNLGFEQSLEQPL